MKTLARLIYHGYRENGGIFIGAGAIDHDFFEHNSVYEVVEVLGQTMIRKLGTSTIREMHELSDDSLKIPRRHWGLQIDELIDEGGRELWLTREEYEKVMKEREGN